MTKYTQEELLFLAKNYEEFEYQIEQLGYELIKLEEPKFKKYFQSHFTITQVFLDETQAVGHQVSFSADDWCGQINVTFPLSWLASDLDVAKFKYKAIAEENVRKKAEDKRQEQEQSDLREYERLKARLGK